MNVCLTGLPVAGPWGLLGTGLVSLGQEDEELGRSPTVGLTESGQG